MTDDLDAILANMSESELHELDRVLAEEYSKKWNPNPGPQQLALESEADILLYGGAAGGGKTDLIIGAALMYHQRSLVVRRQSTELDGIESRCEQILGDLGRYNGTKKVWRLGGGKEIKLGGMREADGWRNYAGQARDLMAFDEAGEFLREQVFSLIAWLRSADPDQRCRVILATNPPRGGDGEWLIEEFAPWVDPLFENPAEPGEIRWAITLPDGVEWVEGPGEYERGTETYTAMSRTFIPAKLDDNPFLAKTSYRATLQNLPEPLRSQLLYGDFTAGREDHEWQLIPTVWIKLAQERWSKMDAEAKQRKMLALSADIAGGGNDATVLMGLYTDNFFGFPVVVTGGINSNGQRIAGKLLEHRKDGADLSVDLTGGWGMSAREHLVNHAGQPCHGFVYSRKTDRRTKDGKFGFANERARIYWELREALDPDEGDYIGLPPDSRLQAELTSIRWGVRGDSILLESKDEVRKRIGASPDRADALAQAWSRRSAKALQEQAKRIKRPAQSWVV